MQRVSIQILRKSSLQSDIGAIFQREISISLDSFFKTERRNTCLFNVESKWRRLKLAVNRFQYLFVSFTKLADLIRLNHMNPARVFACLCYQFSCSGIGL